MKRTDKTIRVQSQCGGGSLQLVLGGLVAALLVVLAVPICADFILPDSSPSQQSTLP